MTRLTLQRRSARQGIKHEDLDPDGVQVVARRTAYIPSKDGLAAPREPRQHGLQPVCCQRPQTMDGEHRRAWKLPVEYIGICHSAHACLCVCAQTGVRLWQINSSVVQKFASRRQVRASRRPAVEQL